MDHAVTHFNAFGEEWSRYIYIWTVGRTSYSGRWTTGTGEPLNAAVGRPESTSSDSEVHRASFTVIFLTATWAHRATHQRLKCRRLERHCEALHHVPKP